MRTECYYERDHCFIPAHYQPSLLVDIALSRAVNPSQLFRGVRLNLNEIKSAQKLISPEQYLTLVSNTQRLLSADDTSFIYGQTLFPGFYGSVSQALQQMNTCRQVVQHLSLFHSILSPLLTPRVFENDDYLFIYWQDAIGVNEQLPFLVETNIQALTSMIDWLAGYKLPWHYQFSYSQPDYIEQYWYHFGENVSFNRQMNMLILPYNEVDKPWDNGESLAGEAILNACDMQLQQMGVSDSFLDQSYDYLINNINKPLNLEMLCDAFNYSPASMKRKFQKHQTSFQAQVDLVKKHTAIHLFYTKGYEHQQIAEYLQFNDMNNFRRAFKRWTGFTPGSLIKQLAV